MRQTKSNDARLANRETAHRVGRDILLNLVRRVHCQGRALKRVRPCVPGVQMNNISFKGAALAEAIGCGRAAFLEGGGGCLRGARQRQPFNSLDVGLF